MATVDAKCERVDARLNAVDIPISTIVSLLSREFEDMPVNLLNLPGNALNIMCSYLDDRTALRLREVSKLAKEIADVSIIDRKTTVDFLWVNKPKDKNVTELVFYYDSIRDYQMARICFTPVLSKLKHTQFVFDDDEEAIRISMVLDEIAKFLDLMKPVTHMAQYRKLYIWSEELEMVNICTNFLEGKNIPIVHMTYLRSNTDCYPALNFIQKIRTEHFDLLIPDTTKASMKFLNQVADMVETLTVYVANDSEARPDFVSMVRDILSRKYNSFRFYSTAKISHSECEELIKIFHNWENKVSFNAFTTADPMDLQIGLYEVTTRDAITGNRNILIEHLDVNFLNDDIHV